MITSNHSGFISSSSISSTSLASESLSLEGSSGVDLTSLIDIIFIVLVFLLLTANTPLLSLAVDVPQSDSASISTIESSKTVSINIMPSAPFFALNTKKYVNLADFKLAFMVIYQPDMTVVIAADKHAPVEPLMQVLALLQQEQIHQTQVVMEH